MQLGKNGSAPRWMFFVLLAAGAYNLCWGAWAIFFPGAYFSFSGMQRPIYPEIWQCVGMIVGVYGIGYAIAAFDPYRHWPIVLVGLLGKVLGPIGFIKALVEQTFPLKSGVINLTNDVIWWLPFTLILLGALRHNTGRPYRLKNALSIDDALSTYQLSSGQTIAQASKTNPLLICFLRHYG